MTSAPAAQRARALLDLGRAEEARRLLAESLATDPADGVLLCLTAQANLALGEPDAALHAASSAAVAMPAGEWPLRLAAIASARLKRIEDARGYAEAAVRAEPNNWRTHVVRAQVDLIVRNVTETSLAAAQQSVRLAPHEAEAHRALGNVLLERRQIGAAEAALREAARLRPDDAGVRNDLARVQMARRRFGRAALGFADAAALDPSDSIAARNLTIVAARALRVVHLVLFAALIVALEVADNGRPRRAVTLVCWGVAGVALGVFGTQMWRGTRPRHLVIVRAVAARDRLLVAWCVSLMLVFVLLGAAAVVPRGAIRGTLLASWVFLALGAVTTYLRRGRRPA